MRRLKPLKCGFPDLPKRLARVTGIHGLLHLYQQGGPFPTHLEFNLCVMSSIDSTGLFDCSEVRLHFGQLPQGFQEPFEQRPYHNLRTNHQHFHLICCSANMPIIAYVQEESNIHCAGNITSEHPEVSWPVVDVLAWFRIRGMLT